MKRATGLVLAAMLIASFGSSMTYYVLQVRGGSRIYSMDAPVRKGRQLLFHSYPDGTYMSLAASEVEKITTAEEPIPPPAGQIAPGQTVFVGPALLGPNYEAPATAPPDFVVTSGYDSGYDYDGMYWGGGYFPPHPPGPPPRPVPSRIGPNGFPILAPPGTAGSVPPAIGPNGYPILAPAPPMPRP